MASIRDVSLFLFSRWPVGLAIGILIRYDVPRLEPNVFILVLSLGEKRKERGVFSLFEPRVALSYRVIILQASLVHGFLISYYVCMLYSHRHQDLCHFSFVELGNIYLWEENRKDG